MPTIDPTIETWREGHHGTNSVITSGPARYHEADDPHGQDQRKCYDGHLICQSINSAADMRLIIKAPQLWRLCHDMLGQCAPGTLPKELWKYAVDLFAEIKGQEDDDA